MELRIYIDYDFDHSACQTVGTPRLQQHVAGDIWEDIPVEHGMKPEVPETMQHIHSFKMRCLEVG